MDQKIPSAFKIIKNQNKNSVMVFYKSHSVFSMIIIVLFLIVLCFSTIGINFFIGFLTLFFFIIQYSNYKRRVFLIKDSGLLIQDKLFWNNHSEFISRKKMVVVRQTKWVYYSSDNIASDMYNIAIKISDKETDIVLLSESGKIKESNWFGKLLSDYYNIPFNQVGPVEAKLS